MYETDVGLPLFKIDTLKNIVTVSMLRYSWMFRSLTQMFIIHNCLQA